MVSNRICSRKDIDVFQDNLMTMKVTEETYKAEISRLIDVQSQLRSIVRKRGKMIEKLNKDLTKRNEELDYIKKNLIK